MATLWQWVMVCLLLTAAVAQVEAQELASSFDQLLVLVKPGDTVSVTDGTGRETGGTISALSSSSLELTVDGSRRSFLESDARTIRQRRPDPLKNGALWGLGIGAALGLTTFIDTEDVEPVSAGESLTATAVMGGLGAAIGVGLDAIFRGKEVIYSRPARTSASLKVSPLLARGRKGALLSVVF